MFESSVPIEAIIRPVFASRTALRIAGTSAVASPAERASR
jgi:hypothetical protein